ncbi:SIS domain-containing protein [Jeotgalibacillus soli]|uniref:SIS domain-containing protein n=1 Tax=Jeotgalibacillus soli TaxID=889306 RepID=A0A0C2VYS7_9BACL|nr:SIS domain-containing protein [Jeotgalibacillus soli]KIL49531.1 hypothetical protein KP78_09990 [Jeotgalibacillus soli]
MEGYLAKVQALLTEVEIKETETIQKVIEEISNRIQRGGIVQLFGCGHSHLLAEEPYYRAGGLVPVKPIAVEPLMLHNGAVQSSVNEKDPDFSSSFLHSLDIRKEDAVIVISTSGRNPVPIDVALAARNHNAFVVGLLSLAYKDQPSKHFSGKRLEDVVTVTVDNHVPVGDAILSREGVAQSFGPASSVIGSAILHTIFSGVIDTLHKEGVTPPIFLSGNIDGSSQHNEELIQKYRHRIDF